MGEFATQLGMSAANTAIDTVLGLALEGHQDRRQLRQQGKLSEQQLTYDMRKMRHQQELQMKFWEDTNFRRQIEEMQKAGISPGLIYGMSGGGGTTTGNAAAGVNAPSANMGQEILGMQMLNAQRGLIEAQTEKTEAEATKIAGVDTTEAQTRIESLTQGIKNQKAVERLTKVQERLAEIQAMLESESYQDVLSTIRYTARIANTELGLLRNEKDISDRTIEEKVGIVQGELIGLGIANELKRAQTTLTQEQQKKVAADVAQGWEKLRIENKNAITNLINSDTARINANTTLKQFYESVRKNDYDYDVKRGTLELQKFLNNVTDSDKITLGALENLFGGIIRNPFGGKEKKK